MGKSNKSKFLKILCLLTSFISVMGYTHYASATDFQVKGKVVRGTCSFSVSTQEVIFAQPIIATDVKSALDDKTHSQAFALSYNCSEFDFSLGANPYLMKISASNGTSVDTNNKIYPTQNNTNAAFVLASCDKDKRNCQQVDLKSGGNLSLQITENGIVQSNFEVSVIKLNTDNVKPGELVAAVDVLLVEP